MRRSVRNTDSSDATAVTEITTRNLSGSTAPPLPSLLNVAPVVLKSNAATCNGGTLRRSVRNADSSYATAVTEIITRSRDPSDSTAPPLPYYTGGGDDDGDDDETNGGTLRRSGRILSNTDSSYATTVTTNVVTKNMKKKKIKIVNIKTADLKTPNHGYNRHQKEDNKNINKVLNSVGDIAESIYGEFNNMKEYNMNLDAGFNLLIHIQLSLRSIVANCQNMKWKKTKKIVLKAFNEETDDKNVNGRFHDFLDIIFPSGL